MKQLFRGSIKGLKFILATVILVGVLTYLYYFETKLKYQVNMVDVIVTVEDIGFKEAFTPDNIKIKKINYDYVIKNAYGGTVENLEALYGQLASVEITTGTQLYSGLVDSFDLIPNKEKGEFIAPIPNDWIFAVPGSLRRTYYADFYLVKDETAQYLINQWNESAAEKDKPIELTNDQISSTIGLDTPILKNVKVAHTKDNANREVTNAEANTATGVINNIEVIFTQEQLTELKKYIADGNKLYITYTFNTGGEQ